MTEAAPQSRSTEAFKPWQNPARGDEPPMPRDATAPGAKVALRTYALWLARGNDGAKDSLRMLVHQLWRCNYGAGECVFDSDLIAEVASHAQMIADKERTAAFRRIAEEEAELQEVRHARSDAAMVEKIVAEFDLSISRAYVILRNKTPNPSRARALIKLFPWTAFEDWYRPKEKPGRKTTLTEWWHRELVGYRFADFALTEGGSMAAPVGELFATVRDMYQNGNPLPQHFGDFESFRLATFRLATEEAARALWVAYSRWRIESLATDGLCDLELAFH